MNKAYVIIFIFLFSVYISTSEEIQTFTIENTPITGVLNCFAIDSNNVKWIGTLGGGLFKYDGTNWVQYNQISTPSLKYKDINSLAVDKNNILWIAHDTRITKFDGNKFETLDILDPKYYGGEYQIGQINFDKKNNLWIIPSKCYDSILVTKYDGKTCTNIFSPLYPSFYSPFYAFSLSSFVILNDILFFGCGNWDWGMGLKYYSNNQWFEIPDSVFPGDRKVAPNGVAFDTAGYLWIGTLSGGGAIRYNMSNGDYLRFDSNLLKAFDGSASSYVVTDRNGLLWFSGWNYLMKFNPYTYKQTEVWTIGGFTNVSNKRSPLIFDRCENKWEIIFTGKGIPLALSVFNEDVIIPKCLLATTIEDEITEGNASLAIIPNPAGDYIVISGSNKRLKLSATDAVDIRIYNVLGECVKIAQPRSTQAEGVRIDVSDLAPGLYYCVMSKGGDMITKSFIVIR